MAQAMYAAIESKTYQGDTILNGLTSMLGSAGVAAADADLSLIADTGQAPMIVSNQGTTRSIVSVSSVLRPGLLIAKRPRAFH